ncbi:intein splicing region protein [Listeria phage LIS04]|nr:intein splicing region protein [Listeria phage LIS04]
MSEIKLDLADPTLQSLVADMGIDPSAMSDQEKRVLIQVLQEMSEGNSDTLSSLWSADYDETPVDIDTFIENDEYFGRSTDYGNLIYPFWRKELRRIFAPGNKVYEVCVTGGIGLGKSTIAVIGLGYSLHKLLCLRSPQEYYGLTKSSIIGIAFFNITLDQSYGVAYRKLQGMLKESPWFIKNGTIRGLKNKVYKPNKGIEFVVGSQPSHGLGERKAG